MKQLTILPGYDKNGTPEAFSSLTLTPGTLYAVVGHTGSGKSRFMKDLEQLADGSSVTGRRILIDGKPVPAKKRQERSSELVAHLSQSMRFVLDLTVEEFLALHIRCRKKMHLSTLPVLNMANQITPEPIFLNQSLHQLSGGQSRALMIADIAAICDSPVVLIDEIENAGINKRAALNLLVSREKLVLAATHDPHTALMASERIAMGNGAVLAVPRRTAEEERLFARLDRIYQEQLTFQERLRKGVSLV